MNNYSFKSRYLRVMLLSLVFLLTAGQASARYIYFKNESSTTWSQINAYLWDGDGGSSSWPGEVMESIGDSWYRIEAGSCKMVIFNDKGNDNANKRTTDVSIPEGKNAFHFKGDGYNNDRGEWDIYVETTWTIVGVAAIVNGDAWTTDTEANEMVKGADGKYTLIVEKTNLAAGDYEYKVAKNHSWDGSFPASGNQTLKIPKTGDYTIIYTYDGASSLTATATKKVTQVATPTFTPAGGTYDAAQSVTIACATDGATIYYTTDGSNPTTSSTQYSGAIAVNATTTLKAIAAKDGMDNSEVAEATYTINIPTPTAPVVKIHGGLAIDDNSAWDGSGRELTGNDGVYEYTFTKRSDNWNDYFFVTIDGKRIQETNESNNKEVVLNTTYTWKESTGNSAQFYIKNGILTNGNSYTVVINTNDKTIRINGNTAPVVDPKTGNLFINIANGGYTAMTKNAEGNFTWTGNINNDQVIKFSSNGTDAPEYHLASSGSNNYWVQENYLTDINPKFGAGSDYLMKYGSGDYIVTVNGDYSKVSFAKVEAPMTITKVAIFGGLTGSSWSTTETELTEVSEGVYTYQFTAPEGSNKHWAYKVYTTQGDKYFAPNGQAITVELNSETGADGSLMDNRGNNSYKCEDIQSDAKYLVTMKLNADGTGKVTIKRIGGITTNDIPVYPRGVQSETELAAYDFASNNVVYLLAEVLNHERISPEWQMTKGADGKYHLDGFAMRTTNCHTHKGDKTEEKTVFVRKFTAIDSHEDVGGTTVDLGDVHLSEGKLYNAVFDAQSNVLTLTEDESANGRMPFISLVGNEMKQDQNYDTPRGKKSDNGWQEAWLQYDENGKLLKDRKGNVMYSTMWPPKNPIYFTANIGGERLYSSEQMAFKAQNNYVAKKGSVWKTELQAGENGEAYNHLDTGDFKLEDDVEYVRYVVPDIWYVGAAKIWTGWTGRTNDNGDAQWSNHRNWGYGDKELGSGDAGTPVEAEMPYYLSTEKDHNGNFYFEKPTYFKTIEFFYNTSDYNKSRLYTTLAFGNAQIEAQSHRNGEAYEHGMYKPSVKLENDVTVNSYIIRCYDAATGKLIANNNSGIIAHGNSNPSSDSFQLDETNLADGKYYYEMEVIFQTANGTRTSTVRSNPFIIYFPGVYTTEAQAMQLMRLNTPVDGFNYVTYNENKSTGALYYVNMNDDDNDIASFKPVPENERESVISAYDNRENLWSSRVILYANVPAQYKQDAEKEMTNVKMEGIKKYVVNGKNEVAPREDGSMLYFDNDFACGWSNENYCRHWDIRNYKVEMVYATYDVATGEQLSETNTTTGKEISFDPVRPNPFLSDNIEVIVNKENETDNEYFCIPNFQNWIYDKVHIDDSYPLPQGTQYNTVSIKFPFHKPNVEPTPIKTTNYEYSVYPSFMVSIDGGDYQWMYSNNDEEPAFVLTNVDPRDVINKEVKIYAVYPQQGYIPGDGPEQAKANTSEPILISTDYNLDWKDGSRSITDFAVVQSEKYSGTKYETNPETGETWETMCSYWPIAINKLNVSESASESINNIALDVKYYQMATVLDDQPYEEYEWEGETCYDLVGHPYIKDSEIDLDYLCPAEIIQNFEYDKDAFDDLIWLDNWKALDQRIKKVDVYVRPVYTFRVDNFYQLEGLYYPPSAPKHKGYSWDEPTNLIALFGTEAHSTVSENDGIVTVVKDLSSKAVSSVRFVNVAGQMSDKPFEGMNIMVTTYTDGTTSTAKVIK